MTKRSSEPVPPSTKLTAFSCPHCGALAAQFWRRALVPNRGEKNSLPLRFDDEDETASALLEGVNEAEQRRSLKLFVKQVASNVPHIGDRFNYQAFYLYNVDTSQCFNCEKISVWVGNQMVWPHANEAPPPNGDLPDHIAADYLEAGEIVNASPRGAAALLRLAIQKMCVHLGEKGDNLNKDIAALVAKGMDRRVQRMLDVVRVIGNNAVHPGNIDLRDDRATADRLFVLVNMIADITIGQPKSIDEMYGGLGDGVLASIEHRDTPKD